MASLLWDKVENVLHPWLNQAIASLGHPTMTPVQASTIPLFGAHKDVVVESVTGSGKTLAFVIPVLQHISRRLYDDDPDPVKKGHMLAIVISPTRELAKQIQTVFDNVLQYLPEELTPIKTQLIVGSLSSVRQDLETFLTTKAQILVATPGRLQELLQSLKVHTSSVEVAVLDEADKLLDMGFETDVVSILKKLPKQRRTGLFSATLSAAGNGIFKTGVKEPVKISVSKAASKAPSSLKIHYSFVLPEEKLTQLLTLARKLRFKKCIAYFATCTSVKHFYNVISAVEPSKDVKFYSLHGQLPTSARLKTLQAFVDDEEAEKQVLMTTDVAARGIDISGVDFVIQVDPPTDPDVFLHRCGRTGRANKAGSAVVFLAANSNEEDYVGFMEVKKVAMSELPLENEKHQEIQDKLKDFMLADRARHEFAVKAYVGFIRSYQKHVASSIFRMLLLDYVGVAKMYGLLRLPKMPETKYIENFPTDGWLAEPIDMDTYSYADQEKEKIRLATMAAEKEQKIKDAKARKALKKKNEAWSVKVDTKDSKVVRREKNKRKREAIQKQIMEESSDEDTPADWKDMVRQNKKKKDNTELQGSFDDL